MLLEMARRVVIAPGYGMAVAQAQHKLKELEHLPENDVDAAARTDPQPL